MAVQHPRSGHYHAHTLYWGSFRHTQNWVFGKLSNPSVVSSRRQRQHPLTKGCDPTLSVTMDTAVENTIILHRADQQQNRFIPSGKGLYKWEHAMDPTANNPCWLLLTTVWYQADHYTCRTAPSKHHHASCKPSYE